MEKKFKMKTFLILLIILFSCNTSSKKENVKTPAILERDCGCINDFKPENSFNNTRYSILTNVNIEKKDSREFLTGNCCDVIRKYISDPKGEYEEESVTCVSKGKIKVEINDSTKFYVYVSGPEVMSNEEGKKYFFEKLIQNKKAIFQVEVQKEKDIALMISRKEYLEKTK